MVKTQRFVVIQTSLACVLEDRDGALYCPSKMGNMGKRESAQ